MASISNDKALIHELMEGSGDLHALTAYMSYPDQIPRDTKITEKHHNEYRENIYKRLKYIHKMESYGLGSHSTWYDSKLKGALIFETAQMALDYVIKYKGTSHEVIIYQLL